MQHLHGSSAPGASLNMSSSECERLVAQTDWAATPLGPAADWPQSLKTSLSICLACRFPILLWWGEDMVMLYNDDYIPILGNKHPAMGGLGRVVWEDVWPVVGPMLQEVRETGQAAKAEDLLLLMNRNGYVEEAYFSFSYSPIADESGGVGGIFTPVLETTEKVIGHRRVEMLRQLNNHTFSQDLRLACENLLRTISQDREDVPFGILYEVDPQAEHATLASAFGLEEHPALAPQVLQLNDAGVPWTRAAAPDAQSTVIELDPELAGQLEGAFGGRVTQAMLHPIRAPGQSKLIGLFIAGVSPHRALDHSYRSFFNLLADQVQTSLAEALSHRAELERMEAMAEIDRAKTVFFSNASHELRTPITLMLGPLEELLADRSLANETRHGLEVVNRNAQRLLKLVNALLDFARIEAGKMTPQFEQLDLSLRTQELAEMFRPAIEKAGLSLRLDCEAMPKPVMVDPAMWEKVVLNLLSNALKFTLKGSIEISLRQQGDQVRMQVRDTGVGIGPAYLERVFQRFERIEESGGRSQEGSGIGLAMVRDLVELHGGTVSLESQPGVGTCVTLSLRTAHQPLPAGDHGRPSRTDSTATSRSFVSEAESWATQEPTEVEEANSGRSLVYVVDDNRDMRNYVVGLLRKRYRSRAFSSAEAALGSARLEKPALIVSDVMMLGMDGYDLVRALRRDRMIADIPVLLLSARVGEEARLAGFQAGANDYLEKPFSSRELLARVDAMVVEHRLREIEREHLRRLESVFAQVPAAMAILRGPEHVFELANGPYLELIGRSRITGKKISEALPELEGQSILQMLDQVYRTGEPYVGHAFPLRLRRGDPPELSDCYFDFVYQPLLAEDGHTEGIAVVAFEVTELVTSKRAAELANRAKDEFLAVLGHELRNPLAPIVTALELMKLRGVGNAEAERVIIERQARHLTGLVDDLLDVARIAQGKIVLQRELVSLGQLISEAVEGVSPLLEERKQFVRLEVQAGIHLLADPRRLRQVLANLLTNASKYSDEGSAVIVHAQADGAQVVIDVEDQGRGLSAKMQGRIFEMFFQDAQTLDRARGGLGLGLTIVRSLTALHGGTVTVHSEGIGKGSRFTVRLPMDVASSSAAAPAEATAQQAPGGKPSRRILLVDDNEDAADTTRQLLELLGHEVNVVYDGLAAIDWLRRHPLPELAIVDIGLPGMNGYEVAAALRRMEGGARVHLVAVTGYGQESDRARSQAAGFDRHLVKPVSYAMLVDILQQENMAAGSSAAG